MTDQELKKLRRSDLLELLIAQGKENEQLRARLAQAEAQLAERKVLLTKAGSIAEASLQLNGVFEAAQAAAEQYLENVRRLSGQQELVLETADYKRPRGQAPSPLLEPWYRAKSFSIYHQDKLTEELFSREIVDHLKRDFEFLLPYYDYFVTLDSDPDPREP